MSAAERARIAVSRSRLTHGLTGSPGRRSADLCLNLKISFQTVQYPNLPSQPTELAAGDISGDLPPSSLLSASNPSRAQHRPTMQRKNFRKRSFEPDADDRSDDEDTRRVALEEIKYMQKLRERKLGIPADPAAASTNGSSARGRVGGGGAAIGEAEKEDLVLQDTFAQETAVTIEDPNMLRYVETELAKKKGKTVDVGHKEEMDHVDELYTVPGHLKVKKKNSEESSTQWTTGIAEVQLPIEYKLRNIEETEAAKKMLQEKRLAAKPKSDSNIPSSYSADYFHRGKEYDEKLRRENPGLYKDKDSQPNESAGGKATDAKRPDAAGAGRREAASDDIMLERFRRREKIRVMRR